MASIGFKSIHRQLVTAFMSPRYTDSSARTALRIGWSIGVLCDAFTYRPLGESPLLVHHKVLTDLVRTWITQETLGLCPQQDIITAFLRRLNQNRSDNSALYPQFPTSILTQGGDTDGRHIGENPISTGRTVVDGQPNQLSVLSAASDHERRSSTLVQLAASQITSITGNSPEASQRRIWLPNMHGRHAPKRPAINNGRPGSIYATAIDGYRFRWKKEKSARFHRLYKRTAMGWAQKSSQLIAPAIT